MKLVTFKEGNRTRAGAVVGNSVLDINAAQPFLPSSCDEIIKRGLLPEIQNLVDNASELDRDLFKPLKKISLLPPVLKPGKIICVGLNYGSHASEQGKEPPGQPLLFAKAPSALAGPFDDIEIKSWVTHVDAEAELAVVIGTAGSEIEEKSALNHVAGYMAFNDVTARKFQREDGQWFRSKSFDTFAPCGPWLVSKDEVPDPQNLTVKQTLNGEVMQEGNTSDMIFPVKALVSYISSSMTLYPGDIIATGTPSGVGVFRKPMVFLKDGDTVEVEVRGVGRIRNRVVERR